MNRLPFLCSTPYWYCNIFVGFCQMFVWALDKRRSAWYNIDNKRRTAVSGSPPSVLFLRNNRLSEGMGGYFFLFLLIYNASLIMLIIRLSNAITVN